LDGVVHLVNEKVRSGALVTVPKGLKDMIEAVDMEVKGWTYAE
jgi:hypothetical protein